MYEKNVKKVFKNEDSIMVYLNKLYPDEVWKKYMYVTDSIQTIEELKQQRKRLLTMQKKEDWPSFMIRPSNISRFYKEYFIARFPFVDGIELKQYLLNKDIDIIECAKIIKELEDKLYNEKNYVFCDIGNPSNTMLKYNKETNKMELTLIDPDDVQFDNYMTLSTCAVVCPAYDIQESVMGLDKCKDGVKFNKQIEIRSMYALFYYMMNGFDLFYPQLFERNNLSEYEEILKENNIPENSELYTNSLDTLNNDVLNKPISESLFDLIEKGYNFETYDKNYYGYQHRLIKK